MKTRIKARDRATVAAILLVVTGLAFLTAVLAGCSSNATRHYGPVDPPSVLGEWEGTLLHIYRVPGDSAQTDTIRTHFLFDDSLFSYYHFDNFGQMLGPYQGTAPYDLTDSTIYLHPTGPYPGSIDWAKVPWAQDPYQLSLDYQEMLLVWSRSYGEGIEQEQRIDLRRVSHGWPGL